MSEKNSLKQYDESLTKLVEDNNKYVVSLLKKKNDSNHYETILDYLSSEETLVTPSFVLKRQIQEVYGEYLNAAAGKLGIAITDLREDQNYPWTETEEEEKQLVTELKTCLKPVIEKVTGTKWNRFEDFILGTNIPKKRIIALQLATAFQMDYIATTKFLLSCSMLELSVKNPLDYIFLFCKGLKPEEPLQWKVVNQMYEQFEKRVSELDWSSVEAETLLENGNTYLLQSWLEDKIEGAISEKEQEMLLAELVDYMVENHYRFTGVSYSNKGKAFDKAFTNISISKSNLSSYMEVLKALAMLYKEFHTFNKNHELITKKVEVDQDGSPNASQLVKAMEQYHGWDFADFAKEKKKNGGSDAGTGSAASSKHDKAIFDYPAFRKYVVIFCKGFNSHIRKVSNLNSKHVNVDVIERSDIVYLAYMFISAFINLDEDAQDDLCTEFEDIDKQNTGRTIYSKLSFIMERLMDRERGDVDTFEKCLNLFLAIFGYSDIYLPFALDRFFLLALVEEDNRNDPEWTGDLFIYAAELLEEVENE